MNAQSDIARMLTYEDFPRQFVWNKGPCTWTMRKRNTGAIGRIYFVSPTAGEHFYLRLLLMHVRGATSFQDLRTYAGTVHDTFKGACLARGLLEDDQEWIDCLHDAGNHKTGHQLRALFVLLLLQCVPAQPLRLWDQFKDKICDDLDRVIRCRRPDRPPPRPELIYDYGLSLLEHTLQENSKSLVDFGLPLPQYDWDEAIDNRFIAEQLDYDPDEQAAKAAQYIARLNPEQRAAFNAVMQSITDAAGTTFFVNGQAGTGKTFLYQALCAQIRSQRKIVLCVASSGIAALLLPGGRTAHSMFKIPIGEILDDNILPIRKNSPLAELIRVAVAVIWDEAAMQNRHCFEICSRSFKDLRSNDRPFGGLTVVLGGDFQQIPPVVEHGAKPQIINASLISSPIWRKLKLLQLRINMRVGRDEQEWTRWLTQTGHGRNLDDSGRVQLPAHMRCGNHVSDLIKSIYQDIHRYRVRTEIYFHIADDISASLR